MTDRATIERIRSAKGRERKAITEAAIRAIREWQDTGEAELPMQRLARAVHDAKSPDRA